jgi:hypothetical protein
MTTNTKVKLSSLKVDATGTLIEGNTGKEVIGFFSNKADKFLQFYAVENGYWHFIQPVIKVDKMR